MPLFGAFERPLGVQLYTVRNELTPATLKAIAAIGYKEVEVTLATAKGIAQGLKDAGLAPTGAHIDGSVTSLTAEKMDGLGWRMCLLRSGRIRRRFFRHSRIC